MLVMMSAHTLAKQVVMKLSFQVSKINLLTELGGNSSGAQARYLRVGMASKVQSNQSSRCCTNSSSRGTRLLCLRNSSSWQVRGNWHSADTAAGTLRSGELVSYILLPSFCYVCCLFLLATETEQVMSIQVLHGRCSYRPPEKSKDLLGNRRSLTTEYGLEYLCLRYQLPYLLMNHPDCLLCSTFGRSASLVIEFFKCTL